MPHYWGRAYEDIIFKKILGQISDEITNKSRKNVKKRTLLIRNILLRLILLMSFLKTLK